MPVSLNLSVENLLHKKSVFIKLKYFNFSLVCNRRECLESIESFDWIGRLVKTSNKTHFFKHRIENIVNLIFIRWTLSKRLNL